MELVPETSVSSGEVSTLLVSLTSVSLYQLIDSMPEDSGERTGLLFCDMFSLLF